MIQAFRIENHLGESIELELKKPENTGFLVASVTGLDYPKVEFSEQKYAGYDGTFYGSQRIEPRNIVMTIVFYENNIEKLDIESLRWKLQRFLIPKTDLKFYVINEHGIFWIKGYVESNEINIFSSKEAAQISIVCQDPYFVSDEGRIVTVGLYEPAFEFDFSSEMRDLEGYTRTEKTADAVNMSRDPNDYYEMELAKNKRGYSVSYISGTDKLVGKRTINAAGGYTYEAVLPDDYPYGDDIFLYNTYISQTKNVAGGYTAKAEYSTNSIEFGHIKSYPSTLIDYDGSGITGVTIIAEAKDGITGLRIDNATRKETIIIDDMKLERITGYIRKFDQIIINTTRGEKSAHLIRDGLSYNIMSACLPIKKWIQLQTGPNVISYSTTSDIEKVDIKVVYQSRYLGV